MDRGKAHSQRQIKRESISWYNWLEQRRRFLIYALALVCVVILLGSALRNPVDYDSYWHARMGEDLIRHGLTPYKDHYSFTQKGEKVASPPVVFQILLYTAQDTLGESTGMITIKLVAFYMALALMFVWLRQLGAPVLVYWLVVPAFVLLLQMRSQVRPELFSYSFSIMALILYKRANFNLTARSIAPIALILLLWTNYHVSIIGYIIFFGLFLDIAVRLWRSKVQITGWLKWMGWGLVLIAVGFLNHDLTHPLQFALNFPDYWLQWIAEYRSPLTAYGELLSLMYVIFPLTVTAIFIKQ